MKKTDFAEPGKATHRIAVPTWATEAMSVDGYVYLSAVSDGAATTFIYDLGIDPVMLQGRKGDGWAALRGHIPE
jgi:hypothetical protein